MRPLKSLALSLCLSLGSLPVHAAPQTGACSAPACGTEFVYVGTHTGGPGQGVFGARFDEETGRLTSLGLAAEIERPTWMVVDPNRPFIYAVSETGNDGHSQAQVYSLQVNPAGGKLTVLNAVSSGGGGATHLSLDAKSKTLFVANYGTGQVSALPVLADGRLAPPTSVQSNYGVGPKPRQSSPHAHSVAIDPSGRFLLSADLGADRVFVYRFDPAARTLAPADPPFLAVPPGEGPRHLAFAPDGRFVFLDTELSGEVSSLRWDARRGRLEQVQTLSTAAATYAGQKSAAEIAVSKDGRYLYVSNRGEDSIVTYAVNGQTGMLTEVQRVDAGGKSPWSFSLAPSGRWMIVADEASSSLVVFSRDPASGKLSPSGQTLSVPKPVNVVFYPSAAAAK